MTIYEAAGSTQDRDRWRGILHTANPSSGGGVSLKRAGTDAGTLGTVVQWPGVPASCYNVPASSQRRRSGPSRPIRSN